MTLDPLAPIRLGVRAGIGLLRFELRVIEHLLGLDRERPEPPDVAAEPIFTEPEPLITAWEPEPEPEAPPPEAEPSVARLADEQVPAPPPEPEEPAHVDVDAELVAEFAEPGAEDGAGPEIHIDEPWDGYAKMRVADIRDRVTIADPAELAVVQLYESANRGRASVLEAVERRSKELANLPG